MTDALAHNVPALAARNVTKAYPSVIANDGVDFEVMPGEIHALLGENGSGKTTLCRILTGLTHPDSGDVLVHGQPTRLRSPADAYASGVFMVHQHFSLVERMTVAENVVLGWSPDARFRFARREVERRVAEAASTFGIDVDPAAPVWRLSLGERQRVEILKALYRGARTLILDEPTTVLTPQEITGLFESLRRLAAEGGSVVFISHKLHEVVEVCDRVTVLRDGRHTGTVDLRSERVEPKTLARLMVGREIDLERRLRTTQVEHEPVLEVRSLSVQNEYGRRVVDDVSLVVRRGEVLGLAGIAGNGQRELADCIYGLRNAVGGDVLLTGQPIGQGDPRRSMKLGLAYVPEDRSGVGLVPELAVQSNVVLKSLSDPALTRGPFLRSGAIQRKTEELLTAFNIKGSPLSRVRQLSGGNAQRVLLGRELGSRPRALVIAAPTRGLDVAGMQAVRHMMLEGAAQGLAVLLISEDLDELLDLCDRIAVMHDGRITGIVEAEGADIDEIGLLMLGAAEAV